MKPRYGFTPPHRVIRNHSVVPLGFCTASSIVAPDWLRPRCCTGLEPAFRSAFSCGAAIVKGLWGNAREARFCGAGGQDGDKILIYITIYHSLALPFPFPLPFPISLRARRLPRPARNLPKKPQSLQPPAFSCPGPGQAVEPLPVRVCGRWRGDSNGSVLRCAEISRSVLLVRAHTAAEYGGVGLLRRAERITRHPTNSSPIVADQGEGRKVVGWR